MRGLAPVAIALTFAAIGQAHAEPPAASPFRWDDDVSAYADPAARASPSAQLKYIPLPLGTDAYLSFGGDLRERVETSDVSLLGLKSSRSDVYDLHRLLVHADAHLNDTVRIFVQLGDETEAGRKPGPAPTDIDRLDLAQAFTDVSHRFGDGKAVLRVGRAEMSFDDGALIGLRDGPNVRQVWDGLRLTWSQGSWRWDAFSVRPVAIASGVFDDHGLPGQELEGVHLTVTPPDAPAIDAFWYHNLNPQVALFGAAGRERTDTFGARLRGRAGAFDGSVGLIGQTGEAEGGRAARAFAAHADAGWRFAGAPWSPHLTWRADVLSGGAPQPGRVETFNALYPNVAYSTEATIEAPANLIQTGLVAQATPAPRVTLQYTVEGLWRYSARDAFYAAPLFPLVRPTASNDRFSGVEQQASAEWRVNRIVTLKAAFVHFGAGEFIRRGGGRDENFGLTSISLRL
jgi:hypothetical protein